MKFNTSRTRRAAASSTSSLTRRQAYAWCVRLLCLALCCALLLQPGLPISGHANAPTKRGAKVAPNTPAPPAGTVKSQAGRGASELLIRFRPSATEQETTALLESRGLRLKDKLRGASRIARLALAPGQDPEAVSAELRQHPAVEFVEPNSQITADQFTPKIPFSAEQQIPRNPVMNDRMLGANPAAAPRGWQRTAGAGKSVIAVIDSGIDFTHPDLRANRWLNRTELRNGRDDNGDGYADDFYGWDYVGESNEIKDEAGHGTAVAGIIAAQGNDRGSATWRASLISLRVLDATGSGNTAAAVEAIDYAIAHGAQVINCAWGTDEPSLALKDAVERAAQHNVLVVCAAGNGGKDLNNSPHYPASSKPSQTLSVAATSDYDALARWSNWGPSSVAVAAPGEAIHALKIGGGDEAISGTSVSAAVVAGVAGLLRALRPSLSAAQTRELIMNSVRPVASLSGKVAAGGVIDTGGALNTLSSLPPNTGLNSEDDSAANNNQVNEAGGRRGSLANLTDSVADSRSTGQVTVTARITKAPAAGLPNLDQSRKLRPAAPRALPPVPSTRRRLPAPITSERSLAHAEKPDRFQLASLLKQSWLAATVAALNGRRSAFDLTELDYYWGDGGYAVSDSPGAFFLPASTAVSNMTASASFILDAPAGLAVTSTSSTQVNLSWTAVASAVGYQVERSPSTSGTYSIIGNTGATSFIDSTVSNGDAYLYRVRAVGGNGSLSATSNLALGTAITFIDPQLTAGVTTINEQHIYDLRTAVNAVRRVAALTDATWQDINLTQVVVKAVHIQELRDRLNEALTTLNISTAAYTDATLTTGANGTQIKKIHIEELRQRVTGQAHGGSFGGGSGLTAKYFDNLNFTGFKFGRIDPSVNFNWGNGSPDVSMGADQFSVRWLGFVQARYSQTYTFYTQSDDGIRVWVGGQLIIDNWTDHVPTENSGTISLLAGVLTPIRVEFYENFGGALAKLEWASASQPREVVPQGQLYPCWKETSQFVRDFYQAVLLRQPTAEEFQDWTTRLLQAQGDTQLIGEAAALGRALFTSQEYANRNPSDNHLFVYDCYRGYLQRDPDQDGWDFWTSGANTNGRNAVLAGFEESVEFRENVRRLCDAAAAASSGDNGYSFASARLDPVNRTGGVDADPYSRNFNWNTPLLNLPGRAGLDLGLTLSYNSLVWTKDGTGITFDADRSTPSPGFRLGFPVVQPRFLDPQTGKETYMLITPSGAHVGLRRINSSNVYESADSSYLQLTDNGTTLALLSTDGTRLSFVLLGGEYHCYEVKDRNGNYITINYDGNGQVTTIVDTLGRTVTFNYDQFQNVISITQPWKREGDSGQVVNETHTWASFGYEDLTLQPSFDGLAVIGTQSGTVIPVLRRLGLDDGSYYRFDYNGWGQVWKITHFAADSVMGGVPQDSHPLSHLRYNLPGSNLLGASPQTDCPRYSEQRLWIENGVMNQSAEVLKSYNPWSPTLTSSDVTVPDGTLYRDFYGTGWQKGLTVEAQVFSADDHNTPKKRTVLTWTQDDENLVFQQNPRVREINVYDEANNHQRTTLSYDVFGLMRDVTKYMADAQTPLRTTRTEYNLGQAYLNRRIIGLPSFQYVYEGVPTSGTLNSKIGYVHDDASDPIFMQALPSAASQHDATNYGSGLRWRGHVNRVRRYDVTGAANTYVETLVGYSAAGNVIFTRDPAGHQTNISYDDSFYQGVNRDALGQQTFAYPTTVTDPDNFSSTIEYHYDNGAVTRITNPKGAILRTRYDGAGRIARSARFDGATEKGYTRWVYPADMGIVQTFALSDEGQPEAYSASVLDGLGQVRAMAQTNPGSTGYSGQLFDYDVMGRLARQSNPTETTTNNGWPATGDDAPANGGTGWVYRQMTYDWQGRLKTAVNVDNTQKQASYSGCGCAGAVVVTLTDEVGRIERVTSDVLGRTVKTEQLNPNSSVYRAVVNTYNVLDQVVRIRDFQGAAATDESCPTGTCQETLMSYDGHGRLASRKAPIESSANTYIYNNDDTLQRATDPRGAAANYGYNNRHLITSINYEAPTGVTAADPVGFDYDSAGNRLWMTDGLGRVDYSYDTFSQLRTETRQFDVGSFALNYDYNLAGEVKSVTDPTGNQINYAYDHTGRLTGVTGTTYGGVSTYASGIQYRAWGGLKHLTYGNNLALSVGYNSRLLPQRFEISGRPAQLGPSTVMLSQFTYYGDAQLRFADDGVDDRFDRAHSYDHVGRIQEAYTGTEARDFINNTSSGVADGPYRQSYQFDVWGNLTSRNTRFWSQNTTFVASYVNNRRQEPLWQYDAAGNVTRDEDMQYAWDAAGRNRQVLNTDATSTNNQWHDGDGRIVKREELRTNSFPAATTTYFVRSSVIGGRIITELNAQGQKQKGYVYAWGNVLAEQSSDAVTWRHNNPVTGSQGESSADGNFWVSVESDPMGVNVGIEDPVVLFDPGGFQPQPETPMLFPMFDGGGCSGANPNCTTCYLDGFQIGCEQAFRMLDTGSALPEALARFQHLPGFQFESVGLGLFRYYVPGQNQHDPNLRPGGHTNDPDDEVVRVNTDARDGWRVLYFPIGFAGFGQQNPTRTPVDRARELLGEQDCANFIAELIYIAASLAGQPGGLITPSFEPWQNLDGSPTPSYDQYYGLNEYQRAVNEGRVTASGNSGRSGNTITYGTTTNYNTISWNREFYSLGRDDAARHIIHESLHLIPNFSDFALAGAAHMLATRNRTSPGTVGSFANRSAASEYLNQQIARHCR